MGIQSVLPLKDGRQIKEVDMTKLICEDAHQRPVRPAQIRKMKKMGGFTWEFFGFPTIDPKLHVIDGRTRLAFLAELLVNGRYSPLYPEAIPAGCKPGDKCYVPCILVGAGKRTQGIRTINNARRWTEANDFKACVNSEEEGFDTQKNLARLFRSFDIDLQFVTADVKTINTTKNAQELLGVFESQPDLVELTLQVISFSYRHPEDDGIYEQEALTGPFLRGMFEFVKLHQRFGVDKLKDACLRANRERLTSEMIAQYIRACSSGSGVQAKKITGVLEKTFMYYMGNKGKMKGIVDFVRTSLGLSPEKKNSNTSKSER
jgi:hypothetical protein